MQYGTFEIPRNDGFRSTFIHFDHVILRNCRANCLHRNKMALRYVQQTKRCVVLKRGRARTIPVITGVLCQVVHRMEERRPIQTFIRGCKVSSFIRIQDQSVNLNYDGNGFNKFFETKTILLNDTTRSVLYILQMVVPLKTTLYQHCFLETILKIRKMSENQLLLQNVKVQRVLHPQILCQSVRILIQQNELR